MYVSKRNIPLLYQGVLDVPVITAENCGKWYDLYIVHPDGKVSPVPVEIMQEVCEKFSTQLWVDHCFHPTLLLLLAKYYTGDADIVTMEVASGRWVMEEKLNNTPFTYFLEDET